VARQLVQTPDKLIELLQQNILILEISRLHDKRDKRTSGLKDLLIPEL